VDSITASQSNSTSRFDAF
jgi:hypothetical protein